MASSPAYDQITNMQKYLFRYLASLALLICFAIQANLSTPVAAQSKNLGYLGQGREQYTLFIFGDAMAGGLWAGTVRVAKGHPRLRINGRYREGSGFARPQIYNWQTRLPRTLEGRNIDIAIVMLGINDGQAIRSNNEYLVFNTPEWQNVYRSSVETMMTQLKQANIAVYWVETPPVARLDLDAKLKIIAKIQQEEAEKAGIRFVKIREKFTASDGSYTDRGADIYGNLIRLRSRNGIRFIKAGNNKLASIVLAQINKDIEIADGDRPVASFPVPRNNKAAQQQTTGIAPYDGPIFSGPAPQGKTVIIEPENLPSANSSIVAVAPSQVPSFGSNSPSKNTSTSISSDLVLQSLKNQAKPNSPAYNLYSQGNWPTATSQTNRVDDFSLPEK